MRFEPLIQLNGVRFHLLKDLEGLVHMIGGETLILEALPGFPSGVQFGDPGLSLAIELREFRLNPVEDDVPYLFADGRPRGVTFARSFGAVSGIWSRYLRGFDYCFRFLAGSVNFHLSSFEAVHVWPWPCKEHTTRHAPTVK
jgi:hypothetical protein